MPKIKAEKMLTAKEAEKPATADDVKTKPGPKPGSNGVPVECPYCGGKCYRKAVQKIKGEAKPYRRYYCVDGCGHYHYRDTETNEIAEVGNGPRECRYHNVEAGGEMNTLRAEIQKLRKARKTDTTEERDADRNLIEAVSRKLGEKDYNIILELIDSLSDAVIETSASFETKLAQTLGIDPQALKFTAKNDSGRPRALVNCLSEADIALFATEEDRETVERLHRALLTVQACIGVYRERTQLIAKAIKGAK